MRQLKRLLLNRFCLHFMPMTKISKQMFLQKRAIFLVRNLSLSSRSSASSANQNQEVFLWQSLSRALSLSSFCCAFVLKELNLFHQHKQVASSQHPLGTRSYLKFSLSHVTLQTVACKLRCFRTHSPPKYHSTRTRWCVKETARRIYFRLQNQLELSTS